MGTAVCGGHAEKFVGKMGLRNFTSYEATVEDLLHSLATDKSFIFRTVVLLKPCTISLGRYHCTHYRTHGAVLLLKQTLLENIAQQKEYVPPSHNCS